MTSTLFIIGGSLFCLLGLMHVLFTFADTLNPKRLVPEDLTVMEAMTNSNVRLSHGGTTMWRAWVGFNFSHGLGLIMFGFGCLVLGLTVDSLALPQAIFFVPCGIGAMYIWLAARYWFIAPVIGVSVSTLFLVLGWLLY